MHTYTDEQLVAYADGELPPAEAQGLARAAAADPVLARRLERFVETRRVLQDAFAAKLAEPVPARLLETLSAGENVVRLRPATRRAAWVPLALAASIAVAIGLTTRWWLPREPGAGVAGLPTDAAALSAALEHSLSGEPVVIAHGDRRYEILPIATLRSASGWCREFDSSLEQDGSPARARAIACRQPEGQWQVIAAAARDAPPAAGGDYAPAGSDGPDLAAAIRAAERLTPAQEAAVIRDNWNTPAP